VSSGNHLLKTLSAEVLGALRPHISEIEFHPGDTLAEPDRPVGRIYFPHSGAISLVVELADGHAVEAAMVGRYSMLNGLGALDDKLSSGKAVALLPGTATVIAAAPLGAAISRFPELRRMIGCHQQAVFTEVLQSVACNAAHSVEERLCRWLLRTRDLAESDDLVFTQERLAQMIAVRRSSVTDAAFTLQQAGIISYRRGHIRVLDLERLTNGACECYATVRSAYQNLIRRVASN
jgi:CRP-like cAMP-binding protein